MPSYKKCPRARLSWAVGGDDCSRDDRLNANRDGGSDVEEKAPLLNRHLRVPVAASGGGLDRSLSKPALHIPPRGC